MKPLAERLRPSTLADYIGQKHLVGEGAVLRKMIESGNLASFILWGPPGVGKTTLAQIIASQSGRSFYSLSAVSSSVKDVRDVIESAEKNKLFKPLASETFWACLEILFVSLCQYLSFSYLATGFANLVGTGNSSPNI